MVITLYLYSCLPGWCWVVEQLVTTLALVSVNKIDLSLLSIKLKSSNPYKICMWLEPLT